MRAVPNPDLELLCAPQEVWFHGCLLQQGQLRELCFIAFSAYPSSPARRAVLAWHGRPFSIVPVPAAGSSLRIIKMNSKVNNLN